MDKKEKTRQLLILHKQEQDEEKKRQLKQEIIVLNYGLIFALLKGAPIAMVEELKATCLEAMTKAINRFDPEKGFLFSTYVMTAMRNEISYYYRDYVNKGRSISVRIKDEKTRIYNEGRVPTDDEVCANLQIPGWQYAMLKEDPISLQTAYLIKRGDNEVELQDMVPSEDPNPEEFAIHSEEVALVRAAIQKLPQKERDVVLKYYFENKNQTQVAKEIGLHQSSMSKILARAVEKIKFCIENPEVLKEKGELNGDYSVFNSINLALLKNQIEELPFTQRFIFEQRIIYQKTLKEVADAIGWTEGSVKTVMSAIKRKFKKFLSDEDQK